MYSKNSIFVNLIGKVVVLINVIGLLTSCSPSAPTMSIDVLTPAQMIRTSTPTVEHQRVTDTPEVNTNNVFSENNQLVNLDSIDMRFVIEGNNEPPPAEVLRQLSYSGGFGGWPGPCARQIFWSERTGFWSLNQPFAPINILQDGDELTVEWDQDLDFSICGLKPGEMISFLFTSPHDEQIEKKASVITGEFLDYYAGVPFNIGAEPGNYSVIIFGDAWKYKVSIDLVIPESPRLYKLDTPDNSTYFLYNFKPDEKILLLIYSQRNQNDYYSPFIQELIDWKNVTADQNGQLLIQLVSDSYSSNSVIALGESSGEVHVFGEWHAQHHVSLEMYEVELFIPTVDEYEGMRKILGSGAYKDPHNPTTINYQISVDPNEEINWFYSWCAIDRYHLQENLEDMIFEFFINDELLENGYITGDFTSYPGTPDRCDGFWAFLRGWETGKEYVLEVRYTLKKDISDGANQYKAGEYRHLINISVR